MERWRVNFVVETGDSPAAHHGRLLAGLLPVARLPVHRAPAPGSGVAPADELPAMLAASRGLIHLPHQHLARHAEEVAERTIVTVHDLILLRDMRGESPPLIRRPGPRQRALLERDYATVRRARAIIAPSEATRRDAIELLDVDPARVFVVQPGVDPGGFRPRKRTPARQPYLLFVGSEQPRKNLPRLLEALAELRRDPEFAELRLVKVGRAGRRRGALRARTKEQVAAHGLEDAVRFWGLTPERKLSRLYSGAACLVLPSLAEGFGLPPLEAMACGCPAVVSDIEPLASAFGEAAVLVDPTDPAAIAAGIGRLLRDDAQRERLRSAGFRLAAAQTWWSVARRTERVYRAVA